MTDPTLAPTEEQLTQLRALGGYGLGHGVLTNEELTTYYQLAAGNLRIAAADALQAVAASTVLLTKVLRTQDLQTDGAKEAETLLKLADRLRAQGKAEQDQAEDDGFGFGIAYPTTGRTGPELTQRQVWGL